MRIGKRRVLVPRRNCNDVATKSGCTKTAWMFAHQLLATIDLHRLSTKTAYGLNALTENHFRKGSLFKEPLLNEKSPRVTSWNSHPPREKETKQETNKANKRRQLQDRTRQGGRVWPFEIDTAYRCVKICTSQFACAPQT